MPTSDLLQYLPPNHSGKKKWPWGISSKPSPATMPDGNAWPKISIVTPSYNQGQFIEETIRSVLLQNYPNLEYIIMDGGSTDNSVEIIKKYEPWLTYWVSEKDAGQADAVYRGFEKASGEIIAWINSDDYYLPNAFQQVALGYSSVPSFDFFIGGINFIDEQEQNTDRLKGFTQDFNSLLCFGQYIAQPACFWTRKSFFDVGGYDRSLKFSFDYDLFLRLAKHYKQKKIDKYLAVYRAHSNTKSNTIWHQVGAKEAAKLRQHHGFDSIDDNYMKKIIDKERLRLLYYKCKSIHNLMRNPKLLLALSKRSIMYIQILLSSNYN